MTRSVFPLPLTAFERYMLLDDRPGYPMTAVVQVDFQGIFDKTRLERAVTRVCARHPLLRATVRGGRHWVEAAPGRDLRPVRWLPGFDDGPREAFEPLDLTVEPGLRLFVQQNRERSRWTAQVHHASVDGHATMDVLGEIALAYASSGSGPGDGPEWTPLDPRWLATRGEARPAAEDAAPPGTVEVVKFLLRRPAALRAAIGSDATSHAAADPMVVHTFDDAALGRIRRAARSSDASVNDLFLCALLQAMAEWNAPEAPFRSDQWLRVSVPMDLRGPGDGGMGVANVFGYVFLDRRERDCGNAAALLENVSQEMRYCVKNRVGQTFLDGLATVDRVPGALRWVLRRRAPFSTVVFTKLCNLGMARMSAHGGPAREAPSPTRIAVGIPFRPGTRAAFALSRLGDALTLGLRTDPRYLDGDASRQLLAAVVDRVHESSRPGVAD